MILELGAEPAYELVPRGGRVSKESVAVIDMFPPPLTPLREPGEFERRAARFFCTWRK